MFGLKRSCFRFQAARPTVPTMAKLPPVIPQRIMSTDAQRPVYSTWTIYSDAAAVSLQMVPPRVRPTASGYSHVVNQVGLLMMNFAPRVDGKLRWQDYKGVCSFGLRPNELGHVVSAGDPKTWGDDFALRWHHKFTSPTDESQKTDKTLTMTRKGDDVLIHLYAVAPGFESGVDLSVMAANNEYAVFRVLCEHSIPAMLAWAHSAEPQLAASDWGQDDAPTWQ